MTDRVDEIREQRKAEWEKRIHQGHMTDSELIGTIIDQEDELSDLQRQVEDIPVCEDHWEEAFTEHNCLMCETQNWVAKCASMERVVEAARTQSEMSPPKIRPETVTEIVSSIIVETGNGEFADYLIDFIEHHQRTNPVTADALNAHDSALTGTE